MSESRREQAVRAGLNAGALACLQTGAAAGVGVVAAHRVWPPFASISGSLKAAIVIMPALFMFSLRTEQAIADYTMRRR